MWEVRVLYKNDTITTFIILGPEPKSKYLKVTISSGILKNKSFKGNLNSFFLFQNHLKSEIKTKECPSEYLEFKNNFNIIWSVTPEEVKKEYKRVSKELEKLNKSSELTILQFDPKKSVRKKKLNVNENKPRKKLRNKKEDIPTKLSLAESTPVLSDMSHSGISDFMMNSRRASTPPSNSSVGENLSSTGFIGNSSNILQDESDLFNTYFSFD
ncbi:hypothetical protein RclHR1_00070019 [Rhizophagus clarus]|uniref:Uncharacterized protein n=1 Tax=Rhizophagus clarus TaxID=94130 RepID=A0A2Z6SBL5_9GLOM|nr:hypothetical protein RclHR1_00070019 [Rhizophagus clarus]GES78190.1 hypothetical protein GLOIN_2v1873675 [Rhizophagus clarus]